MIETGNSSESEVSKETKQDKTSASTSVNDDGEVSAGGYIGLFGIVLSFNPLNLDKAIIDVVGAVVEYTKNRANESIPLSPLNRERFKAPNSH